TRRPRAAKERAAPDLGAGAELLEHRDGLFQPAPNGAIDERAAGFAMAGIIEPDAGPVPLGGPRIQRDRLGAPHVRIEAAEPEQPGRGACAGAHRDAARAGIVAALEEGRLLIGRGWR